MSLPALLNSRATIYRRQPASAGGTDRFGQPYKVDRFRQPSADEEPVYTDVPCRYKRPSGGEVMAERSHDVVTSNSIVYFEPDADVREQDLLTVVGPDGRVKCEQAEVNFVKHVEGFRNAHHIEVVVHEQRQATGITAEEAAAP